MKLRMTFKTPDAAAMALADAFGADDSDERDDAEAIVEKFVKWGEYVTIEVDTETKTATVVPV